MITRESLLNEKNKKVQQLEEKYQAKILAYKQKESSPEKIEKFERKMNKRLERKTKSLNKAFETNYVNAKRIWELDLIRGIAIWGMIIDHWMWDLQGMVPVLIKDYDKGFLNNLVNFGNLYWNNDIRIFIRLFGVFLFVFLCGISANLSKNNTKRGIGIVGVGLTMTVTMAIVSIITKDSGNAIILGTLVSLGLALLIYSGVKTLCKKWFGENKWKWICLGIFGVLAVAWGVISSLSYLYDLSFVSSEAAEHTVGNLFKRFFFIYNSNGADIGWMHSVDELTFGNVVKIILGLKGYGTDWAGLFPFLPYIFLGGFVGETVYKDRKSIIKYFYHKENTQLLGDEYLESPQGQLNARLNKKLAVFMFPGRHTLLIYMFHQAVFVIIFIPIFLLCGYHLGV